MTDFLTNVITYGTATLVGVGASAIYHFIRSAKIEQRENELEVEIEESNYKILELSTENIQLKEKVAELEKQLQKTNNLRVSAKSA